MIAGTGHGVGAALNVHESPPRISKTHTSQCFAEGMIVSDEPGYYEPNGFGIRIESLLLVVEKYVHSQHEELSLSLSAQQRQHNHSNNFATDRFLGFEVLTLIPIQAKMIDMTLMTQMEIEWLNSYHRRVRDTLMPLLTSPQERQWLLKNTIEFLK